MNSNFDKKIKNKLNEDIKIPKTVLEKANIAFGEIRGYSDEKANKPKLVKKQLIAAMTGVCILGSIAFSSPAIAAINSFFTDIGIKKAVDNGYVQTLSEDAVKDNGVKIKVDDIVADKTKIAISFTLNFDNVSKLKNINDMMLGLNIKDNNGQFLMENLEEGAYSQLTTGFESNIDISQKDKGEIKYYYVLHSTKGNLDDINKLSINVDSINLYKEKKSNLKEEIIGNWKFSVKLDNKFTNKENVKFKAENKNDIIDVISSEMLSTGMNIKFIAKTPVDESIINNVILTDENGNVYNSFNSANIEQLNSTETKISMIFDVTSFDDINKLKMSVKNINGEDIIIDLVRTMEN